MLNEISQTCNACGCNLCNFPNREELYSDVPSGQTENAPRVMLEEVLNCNPNSYETIYQVLKNLLDEGRIGELQKWIRVGFDGVPYRITSELINSTNQCKNCLEIFNIFETSKSKHCKLKHSDKESSNIEFEMVFRKVLLAVGAGHMEKNILLAIMQLCKHILIDVVVKKMGFKTINAKNFVTNCGDHRISWQVFLVCKRAVVYVYHCSAKRRKRAVCY